MSSSENKRSKRRRNKRGGGKAKQKMNTVSSVERTNPVVSINSAIDHMPNSLKMPTTLSELDLDNIPQPLTQMPRSHNPYLDREHCLLCRRERPDPPTNNLNFGEGKENDDQMSITPMPLWLCPECRQNVEEEERNQKAYDPASVPQDVFLSSNLPLLTSHTMDLPLDLNGEPMTITPKPESPCQCPSCRERRAISAEQEKAKIKLAECWSELSHMVRCVYLEAGTALADEESSTKLCLPRIAELVERLCAHDPHQLFLRLELEVEDFVKETRERLLKQLSEGYKSPPQAKQFMTMLMEEYAALTSAAQTLSSVLEKLEKEHLSKFHLTWVLHNKHLFHSMVYLEPDMHNKLGSLLKYLFQGANQKDSYRSQESYSKLHQRYLKFSDEMTDLSEGWRDHQQLIENYVEERQINRSREYLAQRTNWDFSKYPPTPLPHNKLFKQVSGQGKADGSDAKACSCKSKSFFPDGRLIPLHPNEMYELAMGDGFRSRPLNPLDSISYLQSIQPPNLSSPSSSDCSSQDDSEELVPIFSRSDLIPPGMCSPRSDDSIDSDDLTTSESSHSASQETGYEEEDLEKRVRNGDQDTSSTTSIQKEIPYQNNQTCECHACNNTKLLPVTTMVSSPSSGTTLTANDLQAQTAPYLFYPNLTNHQPLDLSHHGITAKHPLIHPHLYNLTSQKPATKVQPQPFHFDPSSTSTCTAEWNNAYESAKMILHTKGYDKDPDLLQSVRAALQTNCKVDRTGLLSSYVGKPQPEKESDGDQHVEQTGHEQTIKSCSQSNNLGTFTTPPFTMDAWTRHHLMAQLQQQQQHSVGSVLGTSGTDSDLTTADYCPKHFTAAPQIPTPNKSHLLTQAQAAAFIPSSHQSFPQPPFLTNVGIPPSSALLPSSDGIHLAASLSQSAPSLQTPAQQQQQVHLQHQLNSCKKKKGVVEEDHYHQGFNSPCCTQMPVGDYTPQQQQQVCALHNQPVVSSSAGSAVDQTAASTSTSASVCSDPDCDTHNYDDQDDLYGNNSDDRSSSTTSSSRERDSKHCGCCYCEVFGHGGPASAPVSRNYPEMRDRLRLKLRERKQNNKDESPSEASPTPSKDRHPLPVQAKTLDDIVSFINGEPKQKSSSKAAKRQRQKQRKAEQKAAKQEAKSKGSSVDPESFDQEYLPQSAQSTPTKATQYRQSMHSTQPMMSSYHHTLIPGMHNGSFGHEAGLHSPSGKLKKEKLDPLRGESNGSLHGGNDKGKERRPQSIVVGEDGDVPKSLDRVTKRQQGRRDDTKTSVTNSKIDDTRQCSLKDPKVVKNGPKVPVSQGSQRGAAEPKMMGGAAPKVASTSVSQKATSSSTVHKTVPLSEAPKPTLGSTPQKVQGKTPSKKEHGKKDTPSLPGAADKRQGVQNGLISNGIKDPARQSGKQKGKSQFNNDDATKKSSNSVNAPKVSNATNKQKDLSMQGPVTESKNHVITAEQQQHPPKGSMNGIINHVSSSPASNGTPTSNTTNSRRRRKKNRNGENPNSSIDEIFLPKDNVDMNEMDEMERELEAFKRFCMDSTPQQHKEKVVFNVKDLNLKKHTTMAH